MGSFGENLRREREMRGVTLREISDSTKISVRFLDALESDEFSKLPGGIFTRSFLRSYANYLGLDPEQVLAEFQVAAPPKHDEDFSRIGVSHTAGNRASNRRTLMAWMIAILLLVGGYLLFRYSHQHSDSLDNFGAPSHTASGAAPLRSSPVASTGGPSAKAAVSAPSSSPTTSGAVHAANASMNLPPASTPNSANPLSGTPSASSAGATEATPAGTDSATGGSQSGLNKSVAATSGALPPVLGAGAMVLQISASERSWVAVECDGKTLLQRVLNPSETRVLRANSSFAVTTGNAQGITLTLDGQILKPLGRYGEVKTIRLTLADLKRPTPNP
ncbi:MAG: helix-turn-helix domain-containing protein [Terriglobia bacterium]